MSGQIYMAWDGGLCTVVITLINKAGRDGGPRNVHPSQIMAQ